MRGLRRVAAWLLLAAGLLTGATFWQATGHTHCGQIVPPLVGPVATASRYGERYRCGVVEEGGKRLIVTAGIGTSILPFRLGAPADLWVIEVGGRR
ncbi:MAG: hypothetical protein C0500_14075 [Sphingobium sp.]|nr:hypothetical protein [Sphingobium sp.]